MKSRQTENAAPMTEQDHRADEASVIVGSNLLVRYGDNVALDGVDIQIGHGEDVAIVGESGSGKTTLAKVLTGLIKPAGGSVHYRLSGSEHLCDVAALAMRKKRAFHNRVQLVFQHADDVLHPGDRVRHVIGEALAVALELSPQRGAASLSQTLDPSARLRESLIDRIGRFWHDRKRYGRELLRSVVMGNAEEASRKKCKELSGGERKRVLLARCLASCQFNHGVINGILGQRGARAGGRGENGAYRVIIADEPLRGVDSITKEHIIRLLRTVKRQLDATLVIITHDLRLLGPLCERVLVMFRGGIVEQGRKSDILTARGELAVPEAFKRSQARTGLPATAYHHPYTADLVHSVPSAFATFSEEEIREWLNHQRGLSGPEDDVGGGCLYRNRCRFAQQGDLPPACDEIRPRLRPLHDPSRGRKASAQPRHEVACHLLCEGSPPP